MFSTQYLASGMYTILLLFVAWRTTKGHTWLTSPEQSGYRKARKLLRAVTRVTRLDYCLD